MVLEHYPIEKLKSEIREIVGKHLNLAEYQLFFFGSRVDGSSHEASDIDIGIEGKERIDISVVSEIRNQFYEMPILYEIDFVDFKSVSEKFHRFAKESIELF